MAELLANVEETHPFEGAEKLLEIWFVPTAADVPDYPKAGSSTETDDGRYGLRTVPRQVWEEMLDIVQCKVLSVINGKEIDAYLLSESSLFISPHRLILKTCGTTLNLLGLPRILAIARDQAGLPNVHRCFYSRKSFMFPERQLGPHREWKDEVRYLDNVFGSASSVMTSPTPPTTPSLLDTAAVVDVGSKAAGDYGNGAAYTVGKVNGDHWLLYMTSPEEDGCTPETPAIASTATPMVDYTIEILMSDLGPEARSRFYPAKGIFDGEQEGSGETPSSHAQALSRTIGISGLFPEQSTTLDAYTFSPCGYSANALLKWREEGEGRGGEGYYTIHVTPEEGWSYASFECNVPLPHASKGKTRESSEAFPDFEQLIQRVIGIFKPGRLSLTLFVSSEDTGSEVSPVEAAQRSFKDALAGSEKRYKRTDKINYEFGGYDLAFASFELRK